MYLGTSTISNSHFHKLLILVRNNLDSNIRRIRPLMRLARRNVNMIRMKRTTNNLVNQGSLDTMTYAIRLINRFLNSKVPTKRDKRSVGSTNTLTKKIHHRTRNAKVVIRLINNLDQMTTTVPSNNTLTIDALANFRRGILLRANRNRTIVMTHLRRARGIVVNLQNLLQRRRHPRRAHHNVRRHRKFPHYQINRLRLNQFRHQTNSNLYSNSTTTTSIFRGTTTKRYGARNRRRHHRPSANLVRGRVPPFVF